MSLILEALKKIEREKGVPERGFTVLAATPWPTRHRARLTRILAGGLLVAAGVAAGLFLRPDPPAPPTAAPTAVPPSMAAAASPPVLVPRTRAGAPPVFAGQAPRPTGDPAAPPPATDSTPPAPGPAEHASPQPTGAPAADGLRLQAISERDGRPVAVLNERIVQEGDEFDGIRVVRIGAGEVEVEVRGRRRILTF